MEILKVLEVVKVIKLNMYKTIKILKNNSVRDFLVFNVYYILTNTQI